MDCFGNPLTVTRREAVVDSDLSTAAFDLAQDILPLADVKQNIGSATRRFSNAYVDNLFVYTTTTVDEIDTTDIKTDDISVSSMTASSIVQTDTDKKLVTVPTTTYLRPSTVTGTNITVTPGTGSVALSIPQSVATSASPVFNTARFSGLTSNGFIKTSGSDGTLSVDTGSYLPSGTTYVASLTGTSNQITASASTGAVTLSLPSDLRIDSLRVRNASDPTYFSTLSTDGAGRLNVSAGFGNGALNVIRTDAYQMELYGGSAFTKMNISNNSTGTAGLINTVQVGTGDAFSQYVVSGTQNWTTGVDQSDSNKFKISSSDTLGTSDCISITTAGAVTVPQLTAGTLSFVNGSNTATMSLDAGGIVNFNSTVGQFDFEPVTTTSVPKKINLFDNGNTDSRFCGFGIDISTATFHQRMNSSGWRMVWGSGAVGSTPTELMRLGGGGGLGLGTDTLTRALTVNSATGDCFRIQHNTSTGTATNAADFNIDSGGTLRILPTSLNCCIGGNTLPNVNTTYSLGNSSLRWTNVWSVLGNYSGVLSCADGAVGTPGINFGSDTNTGIYRIGADNIGVACNGTKVIDVLSTGITTPLQPSVNAYVGTDVLNQTGDGTSYTIIFNTEQHDAGSNFNTGTGTFTAPVTGRYMLSTNVTVGGLTSSHVTGTIAFLLNGATTIARTTCNPWAISSGTQATFTLNTVYQLTATNTITVPVQIIGGTKVADIISSQSLTYFSANLLS